MLERINALEVPAGQNLAIEILSSIVLAVLCIAFFI